MKKQTAYEAKTGAAAKEAEGLKNFEEQHLCKITVLHRDFREELYEQYPYGIADACGRLEEGQVFITNSRWDPPDGFCIWAWSDLRPMIQSIHAGHPLTMIACCTDGLRPVTFKLEIIDK
jgi:uncharacterized repeat protein (TIGR04076 family)